MYIRLNLNELMWPLSCKITGRNHPSLTKRKLAYSYKLIYSCCPKFGTCDYVMFAIFVFRFFNLLYHLSWVCLSRFQLFRTHSYQGNFSWTERLKAFWRYAPAILWNCFILGNLITKVIPNLIFQTCGTSPFSKDDTVLCNLLLL